MKQNYWNPSGRLAKIQSHRFPQVPFMSVAYETDAPPAPPAPPVPKPDNRKEDELLTVIQKRIDKALENRATKPELEQIRLGLLEEFKGVDLDALRAMADDKTGVMSSLAKQGLEIQRLNAKVTEQKPKDLSVRGQIAEWMEQEDTVGGTGKKVSALIKDISNKQRRDLPPLELRVAASPMLLSTVNAGASPYIGRVEVESGINDFIRIEPTFWDYIKKGRTNAESYVWVNKTNAQGAAAFIGPGVAKPGVSMALEPDISHAKKVADSAKAGTELLQDIDGMASFIEDELRYKVMIKVNEKLMSGVASSTDPNGIQTLSLPFSDRGIKTQDPNNLDAVRASIGWLRSGLLKGPITVFMNSIDVTNMELSKSAQGVYVLPPFATADNKRVAGVTIVEDNNVTQGYIQAAFLNFYRILVYKNFSIAWGWEMDDFTKNLVTAVGEMRLHQFMNQIHTGAFMYDTIENIKTIIAAP